MVDTRILISSPEQFSDVLSKHASFHSVGFDTEADSKEGWKANMVGFSLSWEAGVGYYIPTNHNDGPNVPFELISSQLATLLQNSRIAYHNAKYDWQVCDKLGLPRPVEWFDTMLAAHSLGTFDDLGLKDIAMRVLKIRMTTLEDLFGGSKKNINFGALTPEAATPYAAADADVTLRLERYFEPKVKNLFIYKLEHDLMPVVCESEKHGMMIDPGFMNEEAQRLTKEIEIAADAFYALISDALEMDSETARVMYPVNSPMKMAELLYDKLELPCYKQTKGGRRSTDGDALEPHRNRNAIATDLLCIREMTRQRDGYYIKLQGMADENKRIHSNFNQCGASSGRFASSGPNMQNISKVVIWKVHLPGGEIREVTTAVRKSFVASPGKYLLEMDQMQVELRYMAGAAQDKTLMKAFAAGRNPHKRTASFIFGGLTEDNLTLRQYDDGKTTNFALIYGMGPDHFYRELEGRYELEEVRRMHSAFFELYPGIIPYHIKVRNQTRISHSVTSYFGRYQLIPEYDMPGVWNSGKADRAGVNRIVQGSCADMMKIVIIRVDKLVAKLFAGLISPIVNFLHDGNYWEVDNSIDPSVVATAIASVATLQFPGFPVFRVAFKKGHNWGEMEDVEFTDPIPLESPQEIVTAKVEEIHPDAQTFVYEIDEIASRDAVKLRQLLQTNPGLNTFIIRMGEKELKLDLKTSLTPASLQVKEILGGVTDDEDISAVASGVELVLD